MRILRLLLISAVLLFLVVTAISLLIPSGIRISRATNTRVNSGAVWEHIDDMRDWQHWNPFFSGEMAQNIVYTDSTGGMPGSMTLKNSVIKWVAKKPDERIVSLNQKGFNTIMNGWKCIQHEGSDSLTIQWYMDFRLRWYPWEKFASLMFEKSYGSRMEQGLANLKNLVEKDR